MIFFFFENKAKIDNQTNNEDLQKILQEYYTNL